MDSAAVDRPVSPRPKLAKTIGVLNVFFGFPLFFCGLMMLRGVAPTLAEFEVIKFEPESFQYMHDQQRATLIETLKVREEAVKDEASKQAIRKQRVEIENLKAKIVDQLDQKVVNHGLERMTWYLWADVVTGAILNLLMLASGIGLYQLQEWARRMAIWVASLKLVRILFLSIFFFAVVISPISKTIQAVMGTDFGKVSIANYQTESGTPTAEAPPAQSLTAGVWVVAISMMTLFFTFMALLYPSFSLILLTRPSARVACEEASLAVADDSSDESY